MNANNGANSNPKPMPSRAESAYKVLFWSTATFVVLCGWFINPHTTHEFTKNGKTLEAYDLISLKAPENNSTDMRGFARSLLFFCIFGLIAMGATIGVICKSDSYSDEPSLEGAKMKLIFIFYGAICISYLILVGVVVDISEWFCQ